jgi:AcrR family transcriptional regulator
LKPRVGRRSGASTSRDDILNAARAEFAERGFDAATIRQIARSAGVDPAMITHHFGTKEKLFMAALDVPLDPHERILPIIAGPRETLGRRLVLALLGVWDSPVGRPAAALLRTSIQHDWSARLLRDFLLSRALSPVIASLELPPDEVSRRTGLIAAALVGLVVSRYILRIEAMASLSPEQVADLIGPTVQGYMTGPLGTAPDPPS